MEAALGTKIPLQTVDGTVTLAIPKGSQNGRRLRLRGKGLPKRGGVSGDIFVELVVKIPDNITHEEEQLFRELSMSMVVAKCTKNGLEKCTTR